MTQGLKFIKLSGLSREVSNVGILNLSFKSGGHDPCHNGITRSQTHTHTNTHTHTHTHQTHTHTHQTHTHTHTYIHTPNTQTQVANLHTDLRTSNSSYSTNVRYSTNVINSSKCLSFEDCILPNIYHNQQYEYVLTLLTVGKIHSLKKLV
jgi:ABC-type Zn2+ transport system substrate-binding protein/surface adhesin